MDTQTITGPELLAAKNYSLKFWLDRNNAPSLETMAALKQFDVKDQQN